MNSLVKTAKLGVLWRKNPLPLLTTVRNHWNKDFMPGPCPKTESEKIAAAKKYGIPVEEYETYPDDGSGCGDYPKLPIDPAEARDPFYPWDFPELKRNFQEILHDDFDCYTEDRLNPNVKLHLPMWALWAQFFGVIGFLWVIYQFSQNTKMFLPVTPPQYIYDGKVHYTFETD
ncbi:NADH dehydrogenase [ubiquinone] 1 beta subcomplex subunit 8, mitochondrial [Euwallacea similis]|uniref:NADH dehydrogenase [ubiquinone] 1 beta subcomplex subunit 8, mitochondrial n=1 Tax=Euwallacea similis TaxID=1736056 RepID=UPI00344C7793